MPKEPPVDEVDAPPAVPDGAIAQKGVDFLPDPEEIFGDVNWTVGADTQIDTTTLTITPPPPVGVTLTEGTQHDGVSKVAILRVGEFKVSAGRTLSVTGSRPLFILSGRDIQIEGLLDAGAHASGPGPGGSSGGTGAGAGTASQHDGTGARYDDSGGGGGSFGTAGGPGGRAGTTASPAGTVYTIANKLVGGASGGSAGACTNPPGAGGGALLLYAKDKIRVGGNGAITVGGGGGAGGLAAGCATGAGAGAGGGSGGAIWLQAPDLEGSGVLAANGGGGGGGGYVGIANGGNGEDGKASLSAVAAGGIKANNPEATAGGNGAIQGAPPSPIPDLIAGNAGGGGGGLGRIFYRAPTLGSLRSSPPAISAP